MALTLTIVRGLPGSGKTSFAKKNTPAGQATFEADDFFTVGGDYTFAKTMLGPAHDLCFGRVMNDLFKGRSVTVANTFTTSREVARYINGAASLPHECAVRIVRTVGEFGSVHGVPEVVIERMRSRFVGIDGEEIWHPHEGGFRRIK